MNDIALKNLILVSLNCSDIMKRSFIFLFLILVATGSIVAEEKANEVIRVTSVPTQYLFYDFPLVIEKRFDRYALGITLAYRVSTENSGEVDGLSGLMGDYWYQNFWNPMYNAFTVGVHSKYFLSSEGRWFIEPGLFYRYWWFDNKEVIYNNVEGYSFDGKRSETQQVYAFKILIGSDISIKSSTKIKPVLEWYCGLGFRYKSYLFKTYEGTVNDQFYIYKEDMGNLWNPSIHLGIRLGIGYFK